MPFDRATHRGRPTPLTLVAIAAITLFACGSDAPDCETRERSTYLNDPAHTHVKWTIKVCLDSHAEPPIVTVDVYGVTESGVVISPTNIVVVERDAAEQRVEAHGGTKVSTLTFDVDPATDSIDVTVGRAKGLTVTEHFSASH